MGFINRGFAATLMLAGLIFASQDAYAQSQEPIIEFHTNIYDTQGAQNQFSIRLGTTEKDYFDIDCGFGTEEQEIGPAVFDKETSAVKATVISCTVNEAGMVRIYGDASKIDYVDLEGCFIDRLSFEKCTGITILDLGHNELKALDLSPFTKLQALYMSDNPFTAETPLKVGGNKPDLAILELDIIDHLDQSFNLSDYPSLVTFDGYHNMDLRNVDPSGCPDLQVLSVELAPVSKLDVSKNSNLTRLNISESRITSIDLSKNPNLQIFLAEHESGSINTDITLESIDLSNNPYLTVLNLSGNGLTEIDLSNNIYLTNLGLRNNNLSAIDLSANVNLYSVDLANNDLDFSTLPLPQGTWGEYYYFRTPLPCAKSYAKGAAIDFSTRVLREGTATSARAWLARIDAEPSLIDESEYEFADGKITFNNTYADSVYVEFGNTSFPDYTLTSATFMVKNAEEIGEPSKIVGFRFTSDMAGKQVSFKVGMDNATADAPRTLYMDLGDGNKIPFTATTIDVPREDNVTFTLPSAINGQCEIYIPENETLTALEIKDAKMSSIDLSDATELRWLTITGCNLSTIDLSTNRCLQTLDLSGNRLGRLALDGVRGNYEKNALTELNASGNRIYSISIIGRRQIKKINLSDNLLTSFDLKDFGSLTDLDLSNNRLKESLNLAYLELAEHIDLSGNALTSLVVVDMPVLETFDITDNNFTLETLPYIAGAPTDVYLYAPQKPLALAELAPGINLSAQNRVIDGQGTTFTWKKADGTLLTEGVDMTCKDGATRFLKDDLGKVYCEMTNPAFPSFAGDKVLKTTEVTVTGAPTTVLASFTTSESGEDGEVIFTGVKTSALYIDWRGDGTEYIQYPINGEIYTVYPNQTYYKGAEVKVYTYEAIEDVKQFAIYGVPMSKMDASPLTNLRGFAIGGAGLDEESIVLPESPDIRDMSLPDNAFSKMDVFKKYPMLQHINISRNAYETFDASMMPALETLSINDNKLKSVTLGNPVLWGLDAAANELSEISFENVPELSQVILTNNKLSTIDLSPLKDILIALDIQKNSFDFSTLPLVSDFTKLTLYRFTHQSPLEVTCVGGKVDLSAQAEVAGTPTEFRWFLGEISEDPDTGELVGEELETGGDDPEYTVENGITTFHYQFADKVTCVMTNAMFENLVLTTVPVAVDQAGIGNVTVDDDPSAPVDVYSVTGIKVRSQVLRQDALRGLAPGFYIVGGKKVLVK